MKKQTVSFQFDTVPAHSRPLRPTDAAAGVLLLAGIWGLLWQCLRPESVPGLLGLGALAALDFSRAFTVFHAVFFPGKDNWLFNPATDEIILIMPERFFLNCALLIGAVLLSACGALIAGDLLSAHRRKKKTVLPR